MCRFGINILILIVILFASPNLCLSQHDNFGRFKETAYDVGFVYTGVNKSGVYSFEKPGVSMGVELKNGFVYQGVLVLSPMDGDEAQVNIITRYVALQDSLGWQDKDSIDVYTKSILIKHVQALYEQIMSNLYYSDVTEFVADHLVLLGRSATHCPLSNLRKAEDRN